MKKIIQDRVDEITARLGRQLAEIGMTPRATREGNTLFIKFRGGAAYLPIELELRSHVLEKPASDFEGSTVHVETWETVPAGDNGWSFQHHLTGGMSFTLHGDSDKIFTTLSETIAMAELVKKPSAEAMVMANEHVAAAYDNIKGHLSIYNDYKVNYSVKNSVETLEFTDALERGWTFDFKGERVTVKIDGNKIANFAQDDWNGMCSTIMDEFEINSSMGFGR